MADQLWLSCWRCPPGATEQSGPIFSMQAGNSAVLVATLIPPGGSGGPDRMIDALVGGLVYCGGRDHPHPPGTDARARMPHRSSEPLPRYCNWWQTASSRTPGPDREGTAEGARATQGAIGVGQAQ